tara:strand:- start:1128 stop:1496 length:369 start_codon:yes stop_codon:yes gene_type:complete
MTIIFSENITIRYFDDNNLYNPIKGKIKKYDGRKNISILEDQIILMTKENIINDSYSLKKNFNEKIIKTFSKNILEKIDSIINSYDYQKENKISLYYNNCKINYDSKLHNNLLNLKLTIINL